ncbi:M56 family metallopeptidase [Acidipila sp. EB88]|uniref:M56 family metallopeptidase n=1 Tax=Acidipila sp. EB88 TaxID=2305226 RepID=UPI0013151BDF|nr:M56 family metallopeptidase [Acidipila sp. EB88]
MARSRGHGTRAHVSVSFGPGLALEQLRLPHALLATATLAYAAVLLYVAARLLWRSGRVRSIAREATPAHLTGEAALCWAACCRHFGLAGTRRAPALATSHAIAGPVSIGLRRPMVLLPVGFPHRVRPEDLRTALAHECAHIARRDFALNLLYELLALPVHYHPFARRARSRVTETREMLCDQLAAAATAGEQQYARSLLRLAALCLQPRRAPVPHAIGILDANAFERRITMLTQPKQPIGWARRSLTLAACSSLALGTCASALALSLDVQVPAATTPGPRSPATTGKPLVVPGKVMAGQVLTRVDPVYPPEAKKAKIQGTIVLQAVIGKDGTMQNLKVVSGPAELQRSAMDAVRQWTYKPYLLNGDPVEVDTTIHVTYSLDR